MSFPPPRAIRPLDVEPGPPSSPTSRAVRRDMAPAGAPLAAFCLAGLLGACSAEAPPGSADGPAAGADTLFTDSPPAWFDAYFVALDVAPDGDRALFDSGRLVDLATGEEMPPGAGLDARFGGTFDQAGTPVVRGRRGDELGWFRIDGPDGAATLLSSVPRGMRPVWPSSGDRVAYIGAPGPDGPRILVGPADGSSEPAAYAVPGAPSAAAWSGSSSLVFLVPGDRGLSTLYGLDLETGDTRTIAADLDGPWSGAQIAADADGRSAYLALASDGIPAPESRHVPDADRDLDIYEVDLATGALRALTASPAEELAPAVADDALYWVSIATRSEAVIVPSGGGEAHVVAENVQAPTWRPDGRALGVTTGGWRLADWALNLDGGIVEIDPEGRPVGPVEPIITGYHEDFSPAWSPDGRWIAYHSHRSPTPVAGYEAEGSTDDIFVRRSDAPTAEEIRLTDFGWEVGTPDWAPDGRRLIMDSWDRERAGGGRGATAWIVEMDPETGRFVGRTEVPAPADAAGVPTWAAWSPTREEIALTFAVPLSGRTELWVMAPDGSSPRRVAEFAGARYGGVDWTADGEALVYSALADGRQQLFRVPRAGGEARRLTDDPANLFHPQVSPDGRWIAATRIAHAKRILRRR